jgi:hypothetical protein
VRVLRDVDDPNQVFVFLELASVEDARKPRGRLLDSGALDRFADRHDPTVVEEAWRAPQSAACPRASWCRTRSRASAKRRVS